MAEVGIGIRSKRSPHTLSITTYFCHSFSPDQILHKVLYFRHSSPHDNIPIRNDVYHRNDDLRLPAQYDAHCVPTQEPHLLTDCSEHWAYRNGRANHSKHAELFIPTIILYTSFSISQQNLSIANDRIILHTLPTLIRSKRNQLTVIISGPRFISI